MYQEQDVKSAAHIRNAAKLVSSNAYLQLQLSTSACNSTAPPPQQPPLTFHCTFSLAAENIRYTPTIINFSSLEAKDGGGAVFIWMRSKIRQTLLCNATMLPEQTARQIWDRYLKILWSIFCKVSNYCSNIEF